MSTTSRITIDKKLKYKVKNKLATEIPKLNVGQLIEKLLMEWLEDGPENRPIQNIIKTHQEAAAKRLKE